MSSCNLKQIGQGTLGIMKFVVMMDDVYWSESVRCLQNDGRCDERAWAGLKYFLVGVIFCPSKITGFGYFGYFAALIFNPQPRCYQPPMPASAADTHVPSASLVIFTIRRPIKTPRHTFVMTPQTLSHNPLNMQSPPPILYNTLIQRLWQLDHPIRVPPH